MLVLSPPIEHTLVGKTVKDGEGRGNWQQALHWLAVQQWGRGEEMHISRRRLCGRGQHQSLWDKRGFVFQHTENIHLLICWGLMDYRQKRHNQSPCVDPFYFSFTAFLVCIVYLCYSPSAVSEELRSQPVCCPVVRIWLCSGTRHTRTEGLSRVPSCNNAMPSEDSSAERRKHTCLHCM